MTSETPEQTAQTPKPYNLKPEAKVQRKAENAQSAVRPEIEERLQKVKMEASPSE